MGIGIQYKQSGTVESMQKSPIMRHNVYIITITWDYAILKSAVYRFGSGTFMLCAADVTYALTPAVLPHDRQGSKGKYPFEALTILLHPPIMV
jgi:hypothetical protein